MIQEFLKSVFLTLGDNIMHMFKRSVLHNHIIKSIKNISTFLKIIFLINNVVKF